MYLNFQLIRAFKNGLILSVKMGGTVFQFYGLHNKRHESQSLKLDLKVANGRPHKAIDVCQCAT